MDFMRDGGAPMWLTLIAALVAAGWALGKRSERSWMVALWGAVLCLAQGQIGVSVGLVYTARAAQAAIDTERASYLAQGISEAVNNSIFGGVLASALLVLSFILSRRAVA